VHRFDAYASDGGSPLSGLIEGRDGFLYGTAPIGGRPVDSPSRHGVVYRMDKAGAVTVMHTFTGPDGYAPWAALVQGADGGLYGSTVIGGSLGLGVLFRVDPATPAPAPAPLPALTGIALAPSGVAGGQSSTGTVLLDGPAPSGGAMITLSSSSSAASVPATVTVPAGATSGSFAVATMRVKRTTTVKITASYNGGSVSAKLTVIR